MARRPAPSNVKVLRGDRRSRINDDEPQPGEEPPTPPPGRDEDWLACWTTVSDDLAVLGVGPYRADRAALICLVDAIRIYQRLAEVVVTAPAVTRGLDGMPTTPSVVRDLRQASAEVSRWATHFGLSPSTRSQVRLRMVGPAGTVAPPASDLLSPGVGRPPRRALS